MNNNITLGIILFIILASCLWNPNLLETLANPLTNKRPLKKLSPKEHLEKINTELTEWLPLYKNMNSTLPGIQKLKTNIILMYEQLILMAIAKPIFDSRWSKKAVSSEDIFKVLTSDYAIKMITVYNGLRAMPLR